MTLSSPDIVTLDPTPEDISEAVRYAIKSGVPYTYNRMRKGAWQRVTRIARGKVNETLIRRFAESLGIKSAAQDKSHRQHDDFDFTFVAKRGRVEADVKTFHVLTQFIGKTREPFSVPALLSGVDHTAKEWHLFFPMLVPQDYKRHKEIYVFAVSVEAEPDRKATSALTYPWTAFPDDAAENFLVDPKAIKAREKEGSVLAVTVAWPENMVGAGNVIYERKGEALQKALPLTTDSQLVRQGLASYLALQLDDDAHEHLWQQRASIKVTAKEGSTAVSAEFASARFHEVFPRQDYALHLIGWIGREEFERIAKPLPAGTLCYFYPPRENQQDKHAPGTKIANWYVLPGILNPIATLTEV